MQKEYVTIAIDAAEEIHDGPNSDPHPENPWRYVGTVSHGPYVVLVFERDKR